MSLSRRGLVAVSGTVRGVPSLLEIRGALRRVRREKDWTLDKLRDESGVDRTAIHKIENTKKYPTYEPGIDTVSKLVEAMGLTLSQFFARIEVLHPPVAPSTLQPTSIGPHTQQQGGASYGTADAATEDHLVLNDPTGTSAEAFAKRLAAICLRASDRSDRDNIRALLNDLVWAFQIAAFTPEEWTRLQESRRQVAARRREEAGRDARHRGVSK